MSGIASRLYPAQSGGKAQTVKVLNEQSIASLSLDQLAELRRALTQPIPKSEAQKATLAEHRWYR
jgi:hypothetical protein